MGAIVHFCTHGYFFAMYQVHQYRVTTGRVLFFQLHTHIFCSTPTEYYISIMSTILLLVSRGGTGVGHFGQFTSIHKRTSPYIILHCWIQEKLILVLLEKK